MAEQTQERSDEGNYRLPGDTTLKHVAKLGIVEDKPIMSMYDKEASKAFLVA